MGYKRDRAWSDKCLDQVIRILQENAEYLVNVDVAPDVVDMKNATDMIVRLSGGDIAVRLRRSDCNYRDLTIRSRRDSGNKTELDKIKDGFGDWYLYGWVDVNDKISEWILVDLDQVRRHRLWQGKRHISNQDGTWFIAISIGELRVCGCLIAEG